MNKVEKLRSLIRESIQEYIKEIDQAANEAAMDARITKCEEAIQMRETKLNNLKNLEEAADMLDETKVKMMEKEINELKKAKIKFEKQKEKMLNKGKKKEVVADAKVEDAPVDEADITAEMTDDTMTEGKKKKDKKEEKEAVNESFLKMQKLAGVITEAQYNQKKTLVENENMTIADFLNANIEEFKQKIANPGSSFEIMGDAKVATAGKGEKGIDVSFDKEHMLKLFPKNDPYNQVEEVEIAGKKVYYNNYL